MPSLAYYLNTNRMDFTRLLESNLCPFDVSDAHGFFRLIWQTLFTGERYEDFDVTRAVECHDINESFDLYLQARNQRTER